MPSLQDLKRAWLLRSLGLSSGGSVADLEAALYAVNRGVASNRKFRSGGFYYRHSNFGATTSTTSPASGTAFFVPFEVGATTAFVSMHMEVTVAGIGNTITMGIYSDLNGAPNVKLIEGSAATNLGELIIPAAITLNPGVYWIAVLGLGGTPSTYRSYASHTNPLLANVSFPNGNNYSHYDLAGQASLVSPYVGPLSLGAGAFTPLVMLKTA